MLHYLDTLLEDRDRDNVVNLGKANKAKYGVSTLYFIGQVPFGPNAGKFAYGEADPEEMTAEDTTPPAPPPAPVDPVASSKTMIGCNIGAGGMGKGTALGSNYVYPSTAEIALALEYGMEVMRMPYRFYRMVRPDGTIDPNIQKLVGAIDTALAGGAKKVIVSEHGYGNGAIPTPGVANKFQSLTVEQVPSLVAAFTEVFGKFMEDERFVPSFVNEPQYIDGDWWETGQAFITEMRRVGWKFDLVISSSGWAGLHSFSEARAEQAAGLQDPLNRTIIDVHQYFDSDKSGTDYKEVMGTDTSAELLTVERAKAWIERELQPGVDFARARGLRFLVGELGLPDTEAGKVAMTEVLAWMHANSDVIVMATWWVLSTWMPFDRSGGAYYGLTQVNKVAPSPLLKRLGGMR